MNEIPTKTCTGECGENLPATTEFFYYHNHKSLGWLKSECKDCENERRRLKRAAQPKKAKRKMCLADVKTDEDLFAYNEELWRERDESGIMARHRNQSIKGHMERIRAEMGIE